MGLVTVNEAAQRLGRSPEMVRRWVRGGTLKSQRFGRTLMIEAREIDKFAERAPVRTFYKISWSGWSSGGRIDQRCGLSGRSGQASVDARRNQTWRGGSRHGIRPGWADRSRS